MAHFYGSAQGSHNEVSRLGGKESGMVTYCAGWGGAVRSYAWVNAEGVDMIRVEKVQWKGIGESKLLYEGPLGRSEGLPEQFGCTAPEHSGCPVGDYRSPVAQEDKP